MFEESCCINSSSSRVQCHEIQGTKLERMNKHKATLQDIIEQHGDPFKSSSDMNDLLTHAVLPENVAKDVNNRDAKGENFLRNLLRSILHQGIFHHKTIESKKAMYVCTYEHKC